MAKASRVAAKTAATLEELSQQVAVLASRIDEIYLLVGGQIEVSPAAATDEATGSGGQPPADSPLDPSALKAKKAAAKAAQVEAEA